jgi:hypothetical protein
MGKWRGNNLLKIKYRHINFKKKSRNKLLKINTHTSLKEEEIK